MPKCEYPRPHISQKKSSILVAHTCRSNICVECLEQLLKQGQSKESRDSPIILACCGSKIGQEKLHEILGGFCKICSELIEDNCSLVSYQNGFAHQICFRKLKIRKVSNFLKNNQQILKRPNQLSEHIANKTQREKEKSQEQKQDKIQPSTMKKEQMKAKSDEKNEDLEKDEQFFPPKVYKCKIQLPEEEFISCGYCKFELSCNYKFYIILLYSQQKSQKFCKSRPLVVCIHCAIMQKFGNNKLLKQNAKLQQRINELVANPNQLKTLTKHYPHLYHKLFQSNILLQVSSIKIQIVLIDISEYQHQDMQKFLQIFKRQNTAKKMINYQEYKQLLSERQWEILQNIAKTLSNRPYSRQGNRNNYANKFLSKNGILGQLFKKI